VEGTSKFIDGQNLWIKLPESLLAETMGEVRWLRPSEYTREYYLEKEIKTKLPNKNHIKIRKKINEYYTKLGIVPGGGINSDDGARNAIRKYSFKRAATSGYGRYSTQQDDYDEFLQREIVKDFQRIYEATFNHLIVKCSERDETQEEFNKRKLEFEAKMKDFKPVQVNPKDKKSGAKVVPEQAPVFNSNLLKVKEYSPSDINMGERYPKYSKWISSIFQFIKDMNIRDSLTGEHICSKIYPQKDGIPVYNPIGRYWVKLFFMGKYRKIEIDDTMPCGKYDEFLMPKCEMLEEMWPALLTKAIFKLFSYRFKSANFVYEETGDAAVIYALTAYVGEKILLDLTQLENMGYTSSKDLKTNLANDEYEMEHNKTIKIIKNILNDDYFKHSQKFLIGFNSSISLDNPKFGFNTLKGIGIEDEDREAYFNQKSLTTKDLLLRKKTTLKIDPRFSPIKSKKLVSPNLIKSINKKNSITINSIAAEDLIKKESVFSKLNIENLEKSGRINEAMKEMLLKNLDVFSSLPSVIKGPRMSINRFGTSQIGLTKSTIELIQVNMPAQNLSSTNLLSSIGLKPRLSESNIKQVSLNEKVNDLIYSDFAYSIVELFYSNEFNMRRLKPVDFSDLRKKIQDAKVSYKQLSKEAKKHYIQNLKDLKMKQKEEKARRLEELKKPGKKFYLIKIKNNVVDKRSQPLTFTLPFNDEEIEMAKKCMLNAWKYPPPEFFDPTYIDVSKDKDLNNSTISDDHHKAKHGDFISSLWTKEFYSRQILNDQVEIFNNSKQPVTRQSGEWLDIKDFSTTFKYFIVLHNPKFYPYSITVDNNWHNYNTDLYQPSMAQTVFYLSPNTNLNFCANNKLTNEKSCVMILFEPNTNNPNDYPNRYTDVNYYLNFDLYDINGISLLENDSICLNNLYSVFQFDDLSLDGEYFLVLRGSIVPFGFHLKIFSDHCLESMSYNNYLKRFQSYGGHNFNVSYPSLEENKFSVLSKFKLNFLMRPFGDSKIIFSVHKLEDNYFKQFIEIYVVYNNNQDKRKIYLDKEINLNSLCPNGESEVTMIITCTPPFNSAEGQFELEAVTNEPNLKIEMIEHIDPFELGDTYSVNKHGVVCQELIYVPLETMLYTSFEFYLKRGDEDIKEKIRMTLHISKGDKILYSGDFFNTLIIHNLIFDNTVIVKDNNSSNNLIVQKDEGKKGDKSQVNKKPGNAPVTNSNVNDNSPFYLYCYLDLSECPAFLIKPNESDPPVTWRMRVFTSEMIVVVKNTMKEDNEKALKETWETNEIGRAENAKKARFRYMAQVKKDRDEPLTQEEENILREIRPRKQKVMITSVNQDNKLLSAPGKGAQNQTDKKIALPNPKDKKTKTTTSIPEINENSEFKPPVEKQLPHAEDHHSLFLKNFLTYSYQDRVKTYHSEKNLVHGGEEAAPYCRSEEEIYNIKEEINILADSTQSKILKEISTKLRDKDKMSEGLNKDYMHCYKRRKDRREKYLNELMAERNELKESKIKIETNKEV
jgi:hypothetical protein